MSFPRGWRELFWKLDGRVVGSQSRFAGRRVGALSSQRCSSELCVRESERRAPIIRFKGLGRDRLSCSTLGSLVVGIDLRGLHRCAQTPLLPGARKLRPNPTSLRTPELLLGKAGTGETRATPLAQWKKKMRCRGVAYVSLRGRVGLHILAAPVPLCESLTTLSTLLWSAS